MSAWTDRVFAALDAAGLTTADDLGDIPQVAVANTAQFESLLSDLIATAEDQAMVEVTIAACEQGRMRLLGEVF